MTNVTSQESGRLGGESCAATQPKDYYSRIGKLGGNANRDNHPSDHFQNLGRQGGATKNARMSAEERSEHARQMARKRWDQRKGR